MGERTNITARKTTAGSVNRFPWYSFPGLAVNFQTFAASITLEENSHLCSYQGMVAEELTRSAVHDGLRGKLHIKTKS
jgi:hypothetical protein